MSNADRVSIGCRMIAEFDDDAASFAAAEPEFVSPPAAALGAAPAPGQPGPFVPPSDAAAAAAKKFWLKVIRRFTEPVPGKKGRLRLPDSKDPKAGEILIEYGGGPGEGPMPQIGPCRSQSRGHEVDVGDKLWLTLYAKEPAQPGWVKESTHPIPWTEIVNIRFIISRPAQRRRRSG